MIRINQVEPYNKGQYECRAENDAGSATGVLTLVVFESPTVSVEPSGTIMKNVGEELRLVCSGRGDPVPAVVWEKMGGYLPEQRLTGQQPTAVHLVRSVTKEDEGTYLCRAR